MPLVDTTDKGNCAIEGRLNVSAIINLFGEGSFDHPFMEPCENLLTASTPSINLANGLRYAWSHLTTTFQEVVTQEKLIDKTLLLTQDIARAGFYIGGTVSPSVADTISSGCHQHQIRESMSTRPQMED